MCLVLSMYTNASLRCVVEVNLANCSIEMPRFSECAPNEEVVTFTRKVCAVHSDSSVYTPESLGARILAGVM